MSGTDQYLAGLKVLIVEDEPFIALDLAFGVEEAGGIPLGPAPSVRVGSTVACRDIPELARRRELTCSRIRLSWRLAEAQ